MRSAASSAIGLLLAVQASCAVAGTMSKCVAANGSISYSDLPCPQQSKVARQFSFEPAEPVKDLPLGACGNNELSRPCTMTEQERLRKADHEFRERHAKRVRDQDEQLARGMARDRELEQAATAERDRQDGEAARMKEQRAQLEMRAARICRNRGLPNGC